MRSRTAAVLIAGLAITFAACGAVVSARAAGVRYAYRKTHATAEWDQPRIVLGAGEAFPTSFPSGWKRAIGWSVGYLDPILAWCDLAVDFETFQHRYDPAKFGVKGATVTPPGRASFRDLAFGFHVHPTAPGSRFYALAELALPHMSRPPVSWTDATGAHVQEGVDQSGNGVGGAFGLGFEQIPQRRSGGLIEGRYVLDPVSGSRSEHEIVVRVAITVPLPTR